MTTMRFISLLMIFGVSTMAVNAQESGDNVAITLERTACFGTCPVYTLTPPYLRKVSLW